MEWYWLVLIVLGYLTGGTIIIMISGAMDDVDGLGDVLGVTVLFWIWPLIVLVAIIAFPITIRFILDLIEESKSYKIKP